MRVVVRQGFYCIPLCPFMHKLKFLNTLLLEICHNNDHGMVEKCNASHVEMPYSSYTLMDGD